MKAGVLIGLKAGVLIGLKAGVLIRVVSSELVKGRMLRPWCLILLFLGLFASWVTDEHFSCCELECEKEAQLAVRVNLNPPGATEKADENRLSSRHGMHAQVVRV